jgi:hypothetical protein
MFKNLKALLFGLTIVLGITGLQAQGKQYWMVGAGLQFNLGSLGDTILNDGLESSQYYNSGTTANPIYKPRTAIYSEKYLEAVSKISQGAIQTKTNGAMTGINLSVGYEKDGIFGIEPLFTRVNVNYTQKLSGGHTTASYAGYTFVDQEWSYKALVIPVYLGAKLSTADKNTSFYFGLGLNWYKGGWGISGTIDGNAMASSPGAGTALNFFNNGPGEGTASIYKENASFKVEGMGFNHLVGISTKISDRGHLFFEAETILSGKMGRTNASSSGGATALAPIIAYPIVLAGTTYRVGFKQEI